MISWNARFTVVAILLIGTALLLHAHRQFVPPQTSPASFPVQFQNWVGRDMPISDEILKRLGPGEFLQRRYTQQLTTEPDVDLYLAYFPNHHGLNHHWPQECLAGSGWSQLESGTTSLVLPGDTAFPANLYVIAKGSDRQVVLFWYSSGGRRFASEFSLAFDSLLRPDQSDNTLLIRMNTALLPGESPNEAKRRLFSFAGLVNPVLNNYNPR